MTDERITPDWLYDALNAEFGFCFDAAATATNSKTEHYCGLDAGPGVEQDGRMCHGDGLTRDWYSVCHRVAPPPYAVWLNPPYSRGSILQWCAKAEMESITSGLTVVLLLPGDTSTEYFHRYVLRHEHRFLTKRLSFAGAPLDKSGRLAPAKFGSVVVVMRAQHSLWSW